VCQQVTTFVGLLAQSWCLLLLHAQGFFRADPVHYEAPQGTERPEEWKLYTPCNISSWCDSTQGFDCQQLQRTYFNEQVAAIRDITGSWLCPWTRGLLLWIDDWLVPQATSPFLINA